jgi:hypothetical protein
MRLIVLVASSVCLYCHPRERPFIAIVERMLHYRIVGRYTQIWNSTVRAVFKLDLDLLNIFYLYVLILRCTRKLERIYTRHSPDKVERLCSKVLGVDASFAKLYCRERNIHTGTTLFDENNFALVCTAAVASMCSPR